MRRCFVMECNLSDNAVSWGVRFWSVNLFRLSLLWKNGEACLIGGGAWERIYGRDLRPPDI